MELPSDVINWQEIRQRGRADVDGDGDRADGKYKDWWWLGKRLAIAGAAITSAPVVAPPLLVLSAIGLAFSLPVAILFTGYIAATKLLRYFLSPPQSQFLLPGPVIGGRAGDVFDEIPVREEVFGEIPVAIGEPVGGMEVEVVDVEGPVGATEVEVSDVESEGRWEIPVGGTEEQFTDAVSEEKVEVPVRVKAAVVYPDVTVEVVQEGAVVSGGGYPFVRPEDSPEAEKDVVPVVVPVAVYEARDEAVETAEDREPGGQDLLALEKISDDIDALRTIVGYTATRLPSAVEELKALYIFTGVEPPSSLGEGCSLEEIRSRLEFLKSVVGVK